jgi:hypothetical protein
MMPCRKSSCQSEDRIGDRTNPIVVSTKTIRSNDIAAFNTNVEHPASAYEEIVQMTYYIYSSPRSNHEIPNGPRIR